MVQVIMGCFGEVTSAYLFDKGLRQVFVILNRPITIVYGLAKGRNVNIDLRWFMPNNWLGLIPLLQDNGLIINSAFKWFKQKDPRSHRRSL